MKKIASILLCLAAFTSPGLSQIKIFSGGDITIGNTTSPASGFKLHVQGNSVFTTNTFTGNSAAFVRGHNGYSTETTPDFTWWGNDQTGLFHPDKDFIGFSTGGDERMRITDNRNLLVGGVYDDGFRIMIDAERDSSALATFTNHTNGGAYAHASYVNHEETKNWVVVYNYDETYSVKGNGDVWCNSVTEYSDSVLKENVNVIQNAESIVLSLRGVRYNHKPAILSNPLDSITIISTASPKTHIGLIAQEVELIVPEVVNINDNGLKGVSYSNLVALLIEAFKELSIEVDSLKDDLDKCCDNNMIIESGGMKISELQQEEITSVDRAMLFQNKPNPFHLKSTIEFYIPEEAKVSWIMIFDLQGNLLEEISISNRGFSSIEINGDSFKPGMYLYSLIVDGKEIDTKRMILTR